MRLIATRSGTYGTRRLRAGEPFDATNQYGNIYIALGRAKRPPTDAASTVTIPASAVPPQSTSAGPEQRTAEDELVMLKAEFTRLTGQAPPSNWGVRALRNRLANLAETKDAAP